MIQTLANIVAAGSYISRPLDLPVHGVHYSRGPTVLQGILQTQPASLWWWEGSPALFQPSKILQVGKDAAEASAS